MLNGQGLVGEVTSVTATTSTVLLASDGTAVVGVALAPSGQLGWVTGPGKSVSGSALMRLQMLNSAAVLKPGDQLVTSASVKDRPYVPGVPVGVVTKLVVVNGSLTAAALVRPVCRLRRARRRRRRHRAAAVTTRGSRRSRRCRIRADRTVTVTAKPGKPRPGASPTPSTGH